MEQTIITALENYKLQAVSIETLLKDLNITSSEDIVLFMKSLNQLIEDVRVIETNQKNVQLIEYTNYMTGRLDLKQKGFGFLIPDDIREEDVFIPIDGISDAMNKDRVLVYISDRSFGARNEGFIKRVIKRNIETIVGLVYFKQNKAFIDPDDKTIKKEVFVPKKLLNEAKREDVVQAKIVNYDELGRIKCEIINVLGHKNDDGVSTLSKIIQYGIDPAFPEKVLNAASKIEDVDAADFKNRRDLRDEKIVTIDGDTAKDFDDAIHIKQLKNGNFVLGVHIADVSH